MEHENGYPNLRDALAQWWRNVWRLANVRLDEIMALSSGLERGSRAQRLFSDVAFSTREWEHVLSTIASDPRLNSQIGQQVGSAIFRGDVLTSTQLVQPFIDEGMVALLARDEPPNPEAIFAGTFPRVEAHLMATHLNYDVLVPLIGLTCEIPTIVLDERTVIEQRGDQWDPFRLEIDRILRDAGERTLFDDERHDPPHYRSVLRIRYTFPKLIGATPSSEADRRNFYTDVDTRTRDCLRSLAAAVFLNIVAWPPYIRELGVAPRYDRGLRVMHPQTVAYFPTPGATLTEALVSPLVSAWVRLRNPNFPNHDTNRAIGVALDRLAGLGSKNNSRADQLVDTVIACEAFFTLGHRGYRQELGFRAAMAAACLSPRLNIGLSRAVVFRLVDKAYNARSRIVHGDRLNSSDLSFDGAPWAADVPQQDALWSFIFWIAELVRRGVCVTMLSSNPGEAVTIDWDSLYFPEGSTTPSADAT